MPKICEHCLEEEATLDTEDGWFCLTCFTNNELDKELL